MGRLWPIAKWKTILLDFRSQYSLNPRETEREKECTRGNRKNNTIVAICSGTGRAEGKEATKAVAQNRSGLFLFRSFLDPSNPTQNSQRTKYKQAKDQIRQPEIRVTPEMLILEVTWHRRIICLCIFETMKKPRIDNSSRYLPKYKKFR